MHLLLELISHMSKRKERKEKEKEKKKNIDLAMWLSHNTTQAKAGLSYTEESLKVNPGVGSNQWLGSGHVFQGSDKVRQGASASNL